MTNGHITDTMLSIFVVLYEADKPMSQYAIAKNIDMSRQTVSNNIKKLINSGIVERKDKKYCVNGTLKNDRIRSTFKDIVAKMYPIVKFESMVRDEELDTLTIMRNIITIMFMLSQKEFD